MIQTENMLHGLKTKFEFACVFLLIASGMIHACIYLLESNAWEEPLSFRKAILFGLSTGLTLWSCLWVISNLTYLRFSDAIRKLLCLSFVLEVFLITLQTWRGQQSHFNRNGLTNASIETAMLILITIAVAAIFRVTLVACSYRQLTCKSHAMAWAIRWGMLLLCLSAIIGYIITWIGQNQQAQGISPHYWKDRGVLKFPHGAALHAIQFLAIAAWIADRMKLRGNVWIIHGLAAAHASWLSYAITQTYLGLDRFEFKSISWILLSSTAFIACVAVLPAIAQAVKTLRSTTD